MLHNMKLSQPAEQALSKVQNTTLSPMEEALFQAWSHANGIEKPDDPNNMVDLRGMYKGTNAAILPNSQMKQIVDKSNAMAKLQQILSDRYKDSVQTRAKDKLANADRGAQFKPEQPDPHPANNEPEPNADASMAAAKNQWVQKQSEEAFSGAQSRRADLEKELFKTGRQPTLIEHMLLNPMYPHEVGHGRRQEAEQMAGSMNPADFSVGLKPGDRS